MLNKISDSDSENMLDKLYMMAIPHRKHCGYDYDYDYDYDYEIEYWQL